jgi:hypothetical protein
MSSSTEARQPSFLLDISPIFAVHWQTRICPDRASRHILFAIPCGLLQDVTITYLQCQAVIQKS